MRMSKENYKEYRKLLYDFGRFKEGEVIGCCAGSAYEHRIKMAERILDFREKHGDPEYENGQDYANYCMIVNDSNNPLYIQRRGGYQG